MINCSSKSVWSYNNLPGKCGDWPFKYSCVRQKPRELQRFSASSVKSIDFDRRSDRNSKLSQNFSLQTSGLKKVNSRGTYISLKGFNVRKNKSASHKNAISTSTATLFITQILWCHQVSLKVLYYSSSVFKKMHHLYSVKPFYLKIRFNILVKQAANAGFHPSPARKNKENAQTWGSQLWGLAARQTPARLPQPPAGTGPMPRWQIRLEARVFPERLLLSKQAWAQRRVCRPGSLNHPLAGKGPKRTLRRLSTQASGLFLCCLKQRPHGNLLLHAWQVPSFATRPTQLFRKETGHRGRNALGVKKVTIKFFF